MVPLPKDRCATLAIEQQLDAMLYLGPDSRRPIAPSAEPAGGQDFWKSDCVALLLPAFPKFEADFVRKLCEAPAQ